MTRVLKLSLAAVTLAALTASSLAAQAADPALGTWVLNVAKSKWTPGPGPKSQTRVYSTAAGKLKGVIDGVGADGKPTKTEYTAAMDGKDYPITGNPNYDMIALTRRDANTIHAVLKKGGKVMTTSHRVVAKDGKTMTVASKGTNAKGEKTDDRLVFDRK